MEKEMFDHVGHAVGDVIEHGVKPDHVAAAMVGHAVFLLKQHGYSNDEVLGIVESALKNFKN